MPDPRRPVIPRTVLHTHSRRVALSSGTLSPTFSSICSRESTSRKPSSEVCLAAVFSGTYVSLCSVVSHERRDVWDRITREWVRGQHIQGQAQSQSQWSSRQRQASGLQGHVFCRLSCPRRRGQSSTTSFLE